MTALNVLFAGGGTGGHLMPGLAVAAELRRRCPQAQILFVGTPKAFERELVERSGFRFAAVDCQPPKRSALALPANALATICAAWRTRKAMGKFRPDAVVGLGGYGCAGPVVACLFGGCPLMLLEQNVIPGRATRLFARWSEAVCCQFAEALPRLAKAPAVCTGNPIRPGIASCQRREGIERLGLDPARRTLLVMGGSQGALALNEAMIGAAAALSPRRSSLQVIHLAGEHKIDEVRQAYSDHGIRAVVEEFLEDMPAAYAAAHLAVSRAGATSLAEIAAAGLPSVLIPYPYAADDHQSYNAAAFVARHAAVVIWQSELTPERLANLLLCLLWNDLQLHAMRQGARALAAPRAAATVVDHLLALVEGRSDSAVARTAAL